MSLVIGTPIDEPMFSRVRAPDVWGFTRVRQCQGCKHRWATVEVTLFENWPEVPANLCPHHMMPGNEWNKATIFQYLAGKRSGHPCRGESDVFSYGGVYRRRTCLRCGGCDHFERYHEDAGCRPRVFPKRVVAECGCPGYQECQHKGKKSRWTTGEFSADGIVVKDTSRCSRCNGEGKILTKVVLRDVLDKQRKSEQEGKPTQVLYPGGGRTSRISPAQQDPTDQESEQDPQ